MRQDARRRTESRDAGAAARCLREPLAELAQRPPEAVLHDHLRLRKLGNVESDISRNYSPDVLLFSGGDILRGHQGVRESARTVQERLPDASFEYVTVRLAEDLGFLKWTARARGARVKDGTDSFLIRDGKILVQTMHYSVEHYPARITWGTKTSYLLCVGLATSLMALCLVPARGRDECHARTATA